MMESSEETLLLLLGFIILTVIVTFTAYMCTINIPNTSSTTTPSSGDTDTNHTITGAGLSEARLDQIASVRSFPSLLVSKSKLSNSSSGSSSSCTSSSCCICLMDYKESDLLRVLPGCGHFFHAKCVDPWLRMNFTCPVCRRTLVHQ
ncbi:hypothetical protein RJT34_23615 [Clitoria ternatea]|uniref:RING-type domain-containing protein n=1 Tax=Clitoria ternatea TaxID=43366 RepID=A0AAN9FV05_CLITE